MQYEIFNCTVNVTNFSDGKMTLNYVTLYNTQGDVAAPSSRSGPFVGLLANGALIAACAISASALLTLIAGLLIWLLRRGPRRVKRTSSISARDLFGGMGFPWLPNTVPQPYPFRAVESVPGDLEQSRPASGKIRSAAMSLNVGHASSSARPVVFAAPVQPAPPEPDVDRIVELLARSLVDRTHDDSAGPPPTYR